MCLLLFHLNDEPSPDGYRFVLLKNRDEYWDRPTQPAAFWNNHSHCIGGLDMESRKEGGTWLAMSKQGKIGSILNILESKQDNSKMGRGFLVANFVTTDIDGMSYIKKIVADGQDYNGFNLVLIEISFDSNIDSCIHYYSNCNPELGPQRVNKGTHSFCNSVVSHPWKKTVFANKRFSDIIAKYPKMESKNLLKSALWELMSDKTQHYPDPQLEKQGTAYSQNIVKGLSSISVCLPEKRYGTRTTTMILIDGKGNCEFHERTLQTPILAESMEWSDSIYKFQFSQPNV